MLSYFKRLFCLAAFGILVYSGVQYAKPWYRYILLKSAVSDMVKFPAQDADTLKAEILTKAEKYNVPLPPGNLMVTGQQYHYKAAASWTDSVDIFGLYHRDLAFSFDESSGTPPPEAPN